MSSLFGITEKYNYLLSQIEDNEGELTPELEEELRITEEELEDKLRAYRQVILAEKANIEYNKDEIKRLRERNLGFEKGKDRLIKNVVQALQMFGNQGKNGNYSLKYPDFTVYTKETESISINENALNCMVEAFLHPTSNLITSKDRYLVESCGNELNKVASVDVTINVPIWLLETLGNCFNDIGIKDINYKVIFDKKAIKELDDYAIKCDDEKETKNISDVMDVIDMTRNKSVTAIYK